MENRLTLKDLFESSQVVMDGERIIGLYEENPLKKTKKRHPKKSKEIWEIHKSYTCPICRKTYASKSNLHIHVTSVHNSARSYVCNMCNKTFTQKCNLKRHVLTHTGEKSFSCVQCGKKFTQKVNLRRHFETHSGKKEFYCDLCGKGFIQKSNLKKHRDTHDKDEKTAREKEELLHPNIKWMTE